MTTNMENLTDGKTPIDDDVKVSIEDQGPQLLNQNIQSAEDDRISQLAVNPTTPTAVIPLSDNSDDDVQQYARLDEVSSLTDLFVSLNIQPDRNISTSTECRPTSIEYHELSIKRSQQAKSLRKCFTFELEDESELSSPKKSLYDWLKVPQNSTVIIYDEQTIFCHISDFTDKTYLGGGSFASVESVTIKGYPDVRMAVKCSPLADKEENAAVIRTDFETMQQLGSGSCPYIIKYYGAMIDTNYATLCICMELMNTTVKAFYKKMHELQLNTSDNLDLVLPRLIQNIVSALQFLQENSYVHGDIKPENLLVNERAKFKLADFGSCFSIGERNFTCSAPPGTIAYFSRDLVNSKMPTIQSDMWAFGISLLEVVNGKHPCLGTNELDQSLKLLNYKPEIPTQQTNEHISMVISRLLNEQPQQPLQSYSEILSMSFIRDLPGEPTIPEHTFVNRVIDRISVQP